MIKERYDTSNKDNFRVGTLLRNERTGRSQIIETNIDGFKVKHWNGSVGFYIWSEADRFEIVDCNGWMNYETWDVALWICNDESLYRSAREYAIANSRKRNLYKGWCKQCGFDGRMKTPDRVRWISDVLDYEDLNDMMRELAE